MKLVTYEHNKYDRNTYPPGEKQGRGAHVEPLRQVRERDERVRRHETLERHAVAVAEGNSRAGCAVLLRWRAGLSPQADSTES